MEKFRRILQETQSSSHKRSVYVENDEGQLSVVDPNPKSNRIYLRKEFFRNLFIFWGKVQHFCSSLNRTLATHAILQGVGVGDPAATPLAATVTWLVRDGTGMVGSICFAYFQGSSLDADCKKWRLFADVMNDVATLLDLVSPVFTTLFLEIQCISSLCKSVVGVAGSSTRTALFQHQSKRNNVADISAKDASQDTLVNLLALVISLLVIPIVAPSPTLVWSLFFFFTFLHIYSNFWMVKALKIPFFNLSRFGLTAHHFIETNAILHPDVANDLEPVWFFIPCEFSRRISLGCPLNSHIRTASDLHSKQLMFRSENYMMSFDPHQKFSSPSIRVSFSSNATHVDILKSTFQAIILIHASKKHMSYGTESLDLQELQLDMNAPDEHKLLLESLKLTNRVFPDFIKKSEFVGWDFSHCLLPLHDWRYDSYADDIL